MKTAFITDTGCGKTIESFSSDNIFCLPLQISYDEQNFQDMEDVSIQDCLNLMSEQKIMTTSLPSLGRIEELFEELKKDNYERIIAVPICKGLSGTIDALTLAAKNFEIPLTIIDTCVTAEVQLYLIKYLKKNIEEGKTIEELMPNVNKVITSCNTLLVPDDLQHLKRGGRLTPVAAALAGLLKIKPILQINQKTNGKIDVLEKVRTFSRALDHVFEIIEKDNPNEKTLITFAHVGDEETALQLKKRAQELFPLSKVQVIPLANCVSIHTGLRCQAIQYFNEI